EVPSGKTAPNAGASGNNKNRGPAGLLPLKTEVITLRLPLDVDCATRFRKCPVFDRICRGLMECQSKARHSRRADHHIRSACIDAVARGVVVIGLQNRSHERIYTGALCRVFRTNNPWSDEVLSVQKRSEPTTKTVGELLRGSG